jgi:mycothiol synthase
MPSPSDPFDQFSSAEPSGSSGPFGSAGPGREMTDMEMRLLGMTGPPGASGTKASVDTGNRPLSAARVAQVLALAAAAASADGVAPLSEDVLLQVRHGSSPPARDLVLYADGPSPRDRYPAGYAHMDAPDYAGRSGDITAELVIHPAHRRQGYGGQLLANVLMVAHDHGVRIWAHGDLPGTAALAWHFKLTRIRALFQLRMPLAKVPETDPVFPAGVTVRTFVPGEDEAAWLGLNHRAFAHHPEQGSWTIKDLRLREEEPWFDPNGFFLAERDGRVIGFHWTKVHQPDDGTAPSEGTQPDEGTGPIGEVYVVGVDPGQQGGGLGRALTQTGLAHLRRLGLKDVLLYVDEDNTAAVNMYTALGFGRWSTDVMYRYPGS